MDFPSSFTKSFKKTHSRKISIGDVHDQDHIEQQPILGNFPMRAPSSENLNAHRDEVVLKIDNRNNVPRDGNMSHANVPQRGREGVVAESPPSLLIHEFLKKQKAAGDQMLFDVDLEMNEVNSEDNSARTSNLNDRASNSREVKVSFFEDDLIKKVEDSSDEEYEVRKRERERERERERLNMDGRSGNVGSSFHLKRNSSDDQVLRCSSVLRRESVLLGRMKTRSRLMDPDLPPLPPSGERKSGKIPKSTTMKSGMLSRTSGALANEEEEDPLFDEDIPEDFMRGKIDALTLLQWVSLILIVTAVVVSLVIRRWKKKMFRGLELWKWEVLALVVICGRLVSGWVIRIVVFFIERNFMLRKRVLYFVYGVRKAVQNCLWLGLVLIAWHLMFDKKVEAQNQFLLVVNKVMVCLVVGAVLWLVKTLMVKVLASSFHVSTFFDRIQESLFNQYVIETLSGPPLIEIKTQQEEEDRTMAEVWRLQNAGATLPPDLTASVHKPVVSGKLTRQKQLAGMSFKISGPISSKATEEHEISIDHLHKLNHKNISAWNMKRLMNIVRYGTLSTLDEQILGEANEDESAKQIRSELEAKVAARKIFRNVAKPDSKFIYPEDLMRFLREEEAIKALNIVEGSSESTKISKASLKNWVVNAFRERRALALTLNDTKTAVKKLHQMVNVLVGVVILIIWFVLLGLATSKILLFVSSQVVVVAFIFGNTCKTAFEAIIFLFVMHPFDVGDRCEVDGVQLIVEEMNILNTIFLRWDNQKVMYPNSTLALKPIGNYYRSPDMSDSIDFSVHITTPAEKIALMKQRISSFVDNKKEHWYPSPSIVLLNLEGLTTVKFSVWLRHKMNHQDMGEKFNRRAILADEMVKIFKDLDIEYRLYPIDINVRTLPPTTSTRVPTTWQTS